MCIRDRHIPQAINQTFNIGADTEFTVRELAETVMEAMGLRSKLNHLPPRNEVVHAYANHDKAKEIFKIDSTYWALASPQKDSFIPTKIILTFVWLFNATQTPNILLIPPNS